MATTMKLIAKNVLGSDTATVSFSSIPGTYDDLVLTVSARGDNTNPQRSSQMRLNGDSSAIYSWRRLRGSGSTADSSSASSATEIDGFYVSGGTGTSNTFGNSEFYIPNYAGSSNKSVSISSVQETNATAAYITVVAGLWASTSAVTSVYFDASGDNFVSGSSFYLYGVKHA